MDAAAGPEVAASESLTSKWAELTAAAVAAAVATGSGQEQRMEEDIKALAESYARLFDDKDALVVLLAADAQESGEELRAAQEAHARQREALFAFHRAHVATLAEGFARDVGALQHEFQTEKAELVQQQGQEVAEVRQLLQAVDDYKLAKERERHQRHDRLHDVLTRQGQEQLAALRQTLSVQIDALTHNLRGKAPDVAAAVATETEVKALTSKDQALTNQIEAKMRKIDQELQRWKEWRVKMTTSGKEHSERNQSLFNEKRALLDQYRKLKVRLTHFRQEQQQALEALNEEVNAAQDTLHAQIELGLRVLHLAEWAHKKEVQQEAACLQLDTAPQILSGEEGLMLAGSSNPELDDAAAGGPGEPLDMFWRRYNLALLDKLALQERQDALQEENEMLQTTIQQYVDGITVTDETLRRTNPLLVVKGKPPLSHKDARGRNRPTVVDGNHMLQTGRLNTVPFFG